MAKKESKDFWECPKTTCGYQKIKINRNNNIIDNSTYGNIILHFLKHLKKENVYFGAMDIQKIFLDSYPIDFLTDDEKKQYSDKSTIWKTKIRSALASLNTSGYIDTDNNSEITDKYNDVDKNDKAYRSRKRTAKFFSEFEKVNEIYDDWELYSLEKTDFIETEEEKIEFEILEPSGKSPFLKIENDKLSGHGQIQRKEVYDYFKDKLKIETDNFEIELKYLSTNKLVFSDTVNIGIKGENAYGIYLKPYFDKLIAEDYINIESFIPGNVLEFSKIKNESAFLLEIRYRNYFIFVFKEGTYEDESKLGKVYEFPDPDKGGYKFKGKTTGSWGLIINNVRIHDKVIWTISGNSKRVDKKTFWGYGEIYEIDNDQKVWKLKSFEFSNKLNTDELINQLPEEYSKLYKQSSGIINIGFHGTNQIDAFQYNFILNKCGGELGEVGVGDRKKDFIINNLFFQNKDLIENQITTAIKCNKNIILIGPPGTGKSKLAKEICKFFNEKNSYIMCTATSDWSTFDTIGGYRLNEDNELKFYPGIFLQCFKDKDGKDINKWLILDEINRADIDKAFGSLFSALTGDSITIPYQINEKQIELIGNPSDDEKSSESKYIIPKDWRIIATMNTFDKSSLYEMSYAFMRRFAFIPVDIPSESEINKELIKKYVTYWWGIEINEDICEKTSLLWKEINKYRKIGPAIIEDIYKHIKESDSQKYTSALIMYVLPQFEGLPEEKIKAFIDEMGKDNFDFIEKKELINFSTEFFNIDKNRFEENKQKNISVSESERQDINNQGNENDD